MATKSNRAVMESADRFGTGAEQDQRLQRAQLETRRIATSHRENFWVATVLLPARLRQPFYNVYAYCRTADDLADASPSTDEALRGLERFAEQLDAAFAGRPQDPLFVALHHTIEQFSLPKQPFKDLLSAFRQDQHRHRYDSFSQLLDYCRRSANPVGRIVLRLGECYDETRAELSDQICTGLQLVNFWQDVARDHAIGRIYLPGEEMDRFGVNEAMLDGPGTPPPLRKLLQRECERAEAFFERGMPLVEQVPGWLAADVRLFIHGGLATLQAIRRVDFDVLRQRPTVGRPQRLWMLLKAALGVL